jgi:hypothetical protein
MDWFLAPHDALRLCENLPHARQSRPHILSFEVDLLHTRPPLLCDALRIYQDGVRGVVMFAQGALLGGDLIRQVVQPELHGRLAVVLIRSPVGAEWDDLDEHGPGPHEQEMGHGGAVHAQQHVRVVQQPEDFLQLRPRARTQQPHLIPQGRAQLHELLQIQKPPRLLAHDDCQPRLLRSELRFITRRPRLVRPAQKLTKRPDRLPVRHPSGIHAELPVDVQPGFDLREAMHSRVALEVHNLILRDLPHHVAVLRVPPVVEAGDHQHDLAAQVLARDEERDEPVVELMVEVAGVPSGAKHHPGHLMNNLTLQRTSRLRLRNQRHFVHGAHRPFLPFARVRLQLLRLGFRVAVVEHERFGLVASLHANVAAEVADVGPELGAVAVEEVVAADGARQSRGDDGATVVTCHAQKRLVPHLLITTY